MSISELSQFTELSNCLRLYTAAQNYSADNILYLFALTDEMGHEVFESNANQSLLEDKKCNAT